MSNIGRPETIKSKRINITVGAYHLGVLETKKNKSAYIQRLIREDVERNKK